VEEYFDSAVKRPQLTAGVLNRRLHMAGELFCGWVPEIQVQDRLSWCYAGRSIRTSGGRESN
jgi:hypothetical protein